DQLDTCIGCGCLSLPRCQLANIGDRLAPHGPGAVAWKRQTPSNPASPGRSTDKVEVDVVR
ncbi:MAG: hypothetical protein ACRBK7_32645, partial [Acidimicrobiales bacterium]